MLYLASSVFKLTSIQFKRLQFNLFNPVLIQLLLLTFHDGYIVAFKPETFSIGSY